MKNIKARVVKGDKEFFVKAKTLRQISKIFGDYLILPPKSDKVDDELYLKKLSKQINKNNAKIFQKINPISYPKNQFYYEKQDLTKPFDFKIEFPSISDKKKKK